MKYPRFSGLLLGSLIVVSTTALEAADRLKVLLVDGQNNHAWAQTSPYLKTILESSGRFTVDVSTTPPSLSRAPKAPAANATAEQKAAFESETAKWKENRAIEQKTSAEAWQQWHPKFSDYSVVVSNYNGELWPAEVQTQFVSYVQNGGGFVSVHAADNSFPEWKEYNEMIGLGGWGGRNEKAGPYVRFKEGKITRDETPGSGGAHGKQHEFLVEARQPEHPILKGLPPQWRHTTDELYSKLRGPAINFNVLATAYAAPDTNGTGENEPILMTITFGKGRIFHTTLGHAIEAIQGLGFQVTLQRGTEWAATGSVTLPAPAADQLPADHAAKHEIVLAPK